MSISMANGFVLSRGNAFPAARLWRAGSIPRAQLGWGKTQPVLVYWLQK